MKKLILPLAAGFALGLSGAAMAGNVSSDHGQAAAQDHSIVATVSGPQLLNDSQMDKVVAGQVTPRTNQLYTYYLGDVSANGSTCILPSSTGSMPTTGNQGSPYNAYNAGSC